VELFVVGVIDALVENPARAPLLLRSLFEVDFDEPADQAANDVLQRVIARVAAGLEQGMVSGELRRVPVQHTVQTLIGMTVFHFATGEFGDELLGAPLYSATEIRRRKEHVIDFIERALCARPD
jgi:hypothetical protein